MCQKEFFRFVSIVWNFKLNFSVWPIKKGSYDIFGIDEFKLGF